MVFACSAGSYRRDDAPAVGSTGVHHHISTEAHLSGPQLHRVDHYVYIGGVHGEAKATLYKPGEPGRSYAGIQNKLESETCGLLTSTRTRQGQRQAYRFHRHRHRFHQQWHRGSDRLLQCRRARESFRGRRSSTAHGSVTSPQHLRLQHRAGRAFHRSGVVNAVDLEVYAIRRL